MHRILVVEDEEAVAAGLRLLLEQEYVVDVANTGHAALKALLSDTHFDAVLCDLLMPGREGLETIRELRRNYPAMPVIAISGGMVVPALDPLPLAARLGACRTIAKPFRMNQLLAVVAEVLGQKPQPAAAP